MCTSNEASSVMEAAVAESVFDAHVAPASGNSGDEQLVPVTSWCNTRAELPAKLGKRLPGGQRMVLGTGERGGLGP